MENTQKLYHLEYWHNGAWKEVGLVYPAMLDKDGVVRQAGISARISNTAHRVVAKSYHQGMKWYPTDREECEVVCEGAAVKPNQHERHTASIRLRFCIFQSSCRKGRECIVSSACVYPARLTAEQRPAPKLELRYNGAKIFDSTTFFEIVCTEYEPAELEPYNA